MPLFLTDRRGWPVARVHGRIFGEGKELPPYRVEDRLHVAPEEIGPAYREGEEGVPDENYAVEEQADSALRMPRCVQDLSAVAAELDCVTGGELSRYGNVFEITQAPHRGIGYRHLERVEVAAVHRDVDPVFDRKACRSGHMVAVAVCKHDQDRPDA